MRKLSIIDQLVASADNALQTLTGSGMSSGRSSPGNASIEDDPLSEQETKHAAGLMRVNHSGEVCAQALYQGQALTAKLPKVRKEMETAAIEEVDHLDWCEKRLISYGSHTSALNPLWYAMSFSIGAGAGLISDRLSLGFVAATEELVCEHLTNHLQELPEQDSQSRAVVSKMLEDENRHAKKALEAGGLPFPAPAKKLMSLVSKAMTKASYHI